MRQRRRNGEQKKGKPWKKRDASIGAAAAVGEKAYIRRKQR